MFLQFRKAEIELLFDNKPSSSGEVNNFKSQAAAEVQVLEGAPHVIFLL